MFFYNNLIKACSIKNIKVSNLTALLGFSTGNLSKWKAGTIPNGEILLKIADYLDVSVDYLLGRTDNPEVNK
jgi:transcriptional regulator with XRE-family HTH domain